MKMGDFETGFCETALKSHDSAPQKTANASDLSKKSIPQSKNGERRRPKCPNRKINTFLVV